MEHTHKFTKDWTPDDAQEAVEHVYNSLRPALKGSGAQHLLDDLLCIGNWIQDNKEEDNDEANSENRTGRQPDA